MVTQRKNPTLTNRGWGTRRDPQSVWIERSGGRASIEETADSSLRSE